MKKNKLLSIIFVILTLSFSTMDVYATVMWENYFNFASVICDNEPEITNNCWTVKLKHIGSGGIWCAQMYTKDIPHIVFNQKYQLHCTLKSTNCDKWVFIKISNAYGKWIKLKKGTPLTINTVFIAQSNSSDNISFSFGGENGNSALINNTDYSFIPGGKTFIAANPDPEPTTSTTISCSDFYLGPVISKTSLSKIKRTGNTAKITMKKVKDIQGYQIQYSTSKKFKAKKTKTVTTNKTTYTIKKLRKNTKYYVRVRPYKKISKTKIYGNWSKLKTIAKK